MTRTMTEPRIQIGDHVLTEGQSMAVRVAIASFHMETGRQEARDDLGPIADAYHERLCEVLTFIMIDTGYVPPHPQS